jgi:hypothetical protein
MKQVNNTVDQFLSDKAPEDVEDSSLDRRWQVLARWMEICDLTSQSSSFAQGTMLEYKFSISAIIGVWLWVFTAL